MYAIKNLIPCLIVLVAVNISCDREKDTPGSYPIQPVPFTSVKLTDNFWSPKIRINHEVTIPIAIEQSRITGRIKNFEIAGGLKEGEFCSQYPFDDSDIYKIIEAASFSLQTYPDPDLEKTLDSLIHLISLAQEEDGYIYTNLTIAEKNHSEAHPWVGGNRWEKVHDLSHELYNLGHLFEAAVAHYQATSKRNFLDIAIKAADMLVNTFGWGKIEDYPGHQVVEMGLVKLYLATGEQKYLDLAKFFLDVRGPDGPEYCQAHKKVTDQAEAVGHAVRATYMYAAMADIAALFEDDSYVHANRLIWEDMVYGKTYVTGGIGASGGNEGFAKPYELPNMSAYCETCASVGNIFWNYRMFLHEGSSDYFDVLERTLYNSLLSGVALSGDRFFYPNVLESIGQHERSRWFGCACCPPNIARLLPSIPGYIYSKTNASLYVNLYMSNEAETVIKDSKVKIILTSGFPWKGDVRLDMIPEKATRFELKLRIPGWAQNSAIPGDLYYFPDTLENEIEIRVNDNPVSYKMEDGYAVIGRKWTGGDVVEFSFPFAARKVLADDRVKDDLNKMAVQRGPFVYALEWCDVKDGKALNLLADPGQEFRFTTEPELLNGIVTVDLKARLVKSKPGGGLDYEEGQVVKMIPYYAWNNRGPGEMAVWLPYNEESARPLPAPSIASKSRVTASHPTKGLIAVNDQLLPENSNDHTWPYYHWWPKNNSTEWIQYDFEEATSISKSTVYWYDDLPSGGCTVPEKWRLLVQKGSSWVPVKNRNNYEITKDSWNMVEFEPVMTRAIRLEVKLPGRLSSGVHEWTVE